MSNGKKVSGAQHSPPSLTFSEKAWNQMWFLTQEGVREGNFEVSSLGLVSKDDPCYVEEFFIVEQVNTGSTTKFDEEGFAKLMMELATKGVDTSLLKVWHHTHANFNVFWSTTDTANIDRYDADGIQWSVVTNSDYDILVRADIFKPLRFSWDKLDYYVDRDYESAKKWYEESKEKITYQKHVPKKYSNYSHKGHYATKYGHQGGSSRVDPFAPPGLLWEPQAAPATKIGGIKASSTKTTGATPQGTSTQDTPDSTKTFRPPHLEENRKIANQFDDDLIEDSFRGGFISYTEARSLELALASKGEAEMVVLFDKLLRRKYGQKDGELVLDHTLSSIYEDPKGMKKSLSLGGVS